MEAFDKAGIKEDRDVLEFLFDMVGERFNTSRVQQETTNTEGGNPSSSSEDDRVLSVSYFINKLFNSAETQEINEVDQILQNLKATLIYKGLDFSVIFAEQGSAEDRGGRRGKTAASEDGERKRYKGAAEFDLTSHYTRFSQ